MPAKLGQSWFIGLTNFSQSNKKMHRAGRNLALEAIEPRRLYRQVADQLRAYLDSGAIPVGARMPSGRSPNSSMSLARRSGKR
jgi:hypothetical protein